MMCMHVFPTIKRINSTTALRQIGGEVDREIPSTLVDAWAMACKTKCKAAKNKLFNAWLQAGGDWGMLHGCSNQIQSSECFLFVMCFWGYCGLSKADSHSDPIPYWQGTWTPQRRSWPYKTISLDSIFKVTIDVSTIHIMNTTFLITPQVGGLETSWWWCTTGIPKQWMQLSGGKHSWVFAEITQTCPVMKAWDSTMCLIWMDCQKIPSYKLYIIISMGVLRIAPPNECMFNSGSFGHLQHLGTRDCGHYSAVHFCGCCDGQWGTRAIISKYIYTYIMHVYVPPSS